ncbi:proline-specific peptidase [Lentinus brumalis]|uniref:Proline-specific peptidase n=1 Tax=Lentinus brumalis TaxID=2498619 RepID=A0A371DXC7_9APHY|nr:proline-specific peptidase [Polyporus brumalis]
MKEGFIPFTHQKETHQTYYKVFGDLRNSTSTPIVVLHGGPGLSHDYQLPHADLAGKACGSHPVIFYDQIGNARSTRLPHKPPPFWKIDLFLDELENLLRYFGIQDAFHLVGHSWGGMLGSEFVVRRHPPGLKRFVCANAPAAIELWSRSFGELLEGFPSEIRDVISGNREDNPKAYLDALLKVYAVHGCRVQPFPEEFLTSVLYNNGLDADRTVADAGVMKGWSIVDRLHLVKVPTLVINGRYDIAQDWVIESYVKRVPNASWIKFENSSHLPCFEEREGYMDAVAKFLKE